MFEHPRWIGHCLFPALALLACASACDQQDPNAVTDEADTRDESAPTDSQATTTVDDASGEATTPSDTTTPDTSDTEAEGSSTPDADASAPEESDATGTDVGGDSDDVSDETGADETTSDPVTEAGIDPEPADDYFPMLNGAIWTYRHTKVGEEVWNEVVTMTEAAGDDAPGYLLVDQPNRDGEATEQVWRWVDTAVMRVSRRELVDGNLLRLSTYDPGFTRFDTRWVTQGFEETVTYTRMEQEAGLGPVTEQRTQHFEVLDTQATVTIDTETYERCLLVARSRPDTGDVGHYWFAPGVGKVKELDPDSMTMEELIDFSLP